MILKKVTILGFKSFADKTEIILNKGITAFVGPNGCGKSNVVDAIRWVLGEQSIKVLRGGKTEDVIFHGCDSRKSIGMAEVSLTFDNSSGRLPVDYSEVTVTRRLYRSGESQYLINKTQCRLKDVYRLFLDTGVGTSTYSIIEQGEMDWIINAKPSERREIFEEAAGITKYKVKKKEAERKLKYAEDNLLRLRDIINELEGQIGTVSRQAAKAKRFKKLSGELQFLDCQNTLRKYDNLKAQIDQDKSNLTENEINIENLKKSVSEQENLHLEDLLAIEQFDLQLKELTSKKFELENKIREIVQANEFKTSKINDLNTRLDSEDSNKKAYEERFQELDKLLNECIQAKDALIKDFESKKEIVENKSFKVNLITTEIEDKKKFIFEFKAKLEENSNQVSSTQNKIVEYNILEKNHEQQLEKISDSISEIQLSLNFEEDQLDSETQKIQALKNKLEQTAKELTTHEEAFSSNTKRLTSLEAEMMKTSSEISEKSSRMEALTDLKNSYEGFFTGVRAVMLNKQENPESWGGIVDVVPGIMKVHQGYETAVEASLGGKLQNIIVETGNDAKKAIDFLKTHKLGRVTFLPLDLMEKKERNDNFPHDGRILGSILNFIDFDERYKNVMDHLLGGFLVVRNLDDAIYLKQNTVKHYNLITLDGELIAKSGAITGGEVKAAVKGIFSRENEIEELEKTVGRLRNSLIEKNELRNNLKMEVEKLTSKIDALKTAKTSQTSDLQHGEKDFQKITFQRDSMKKKIEMLYAEQESIYNKVNELLEKRSKLSETLTNSDQENSTIRDTILNYERELEANYELMSNEKQGLAVDKNELQNTSEKISSHDSRINEIKREIKEREEWLNNLSSNQQEQTRLIETLQEEIRKDIEKLEILNLENTSILNSISEASEKLGNIKSKTQDFDEIRKSTQVTIDSLHEKNTMLKVAIAEHEGKIESYQEHVFSKYQVRLLEIEKKESEVDTPWEEVPAKLEDLDQKIKSLGSVNLSAIEELAKLEDRFNFLTEQEKDLLAAKKQLVEVIEKINVTATQMFEDTFNKVKVYFNDIFGELFEGGKAELKLMDSPDMLEAGIDIVAKPGGKTFQTISLLSGGEKALTATALLFALFKVKPSPFCFIDELDAPLDDSNINRFTKLLKSFSDNTQFMVITHNKTTLKIADLLYGVTQPEKGISQLISVKFIDDDLDYLLKEPEVIKATKKGRVIEMKEDEDLSEYVIPEIKPVRFTLPEENAASVTAVSPEQKETITEPIPVRNSTEELLSSEESNALPEAIMERNTLVSIPEENS